MVTRFQQEIGFFGGFDVGGEQYRSATRGTHPEITTPFIDIFQYFRGYGDIADLGSVVRMRIHDANTIGRLE
jgi:hypothetical protein